MSMTREEIIKAYEGTVFSNALSAAAGNEVRSDYDSSFVYRIGETVEVQNFDENRWSECAPGIHHYITREEAVRH